MSIVIENVSKRFADILVINRVSLEIPRGQFFVLLGSSGSGKSSLLRLVAGLMLPDSGNIHLDGVNVTSLPPQKRSVGFVFQHFALFRHMNVARNIEFGLKVRGASKAERVARREELLELVGLGGLGNRMPMQLSGGQRQRVALARALAYKPSVLLLDEPFGALDVAIRSSLRRSLKEIQQQLGVTTILVTHDQEEAFELGDRVGVLERGKLVECGSPRDLYHTPRTEFVATFVGRGNVMVGRAEKDLIRLGATLLPFPKEAAKHEEGAPVRILFRPEDVRHQLDPFPTGDDVVIGQGRVRETFFSGPLVKTRLEIETLRGIRPLVPALHYGQRFASIEASQASTGQSLPQIAEVRWVALSRYHVLDPSGLRFLIVIDKLQKSGTAFAVGVQILSAAHGSATLLAVLPGDESGDKVREGVDALRALAGTRKELKLESKIRQGTVPKEVLREVQESYVDLVVLERHAHDDDAGRRRLAQLVRRILAYGGAPVLLSGKESREALKRILICTAGGEPGKSDVRFAARIARHLSARATVFHVLPEDPADFEVNRVKRHLSQAQDLLSVYNVESEVKIGHGVPVDAILAEVRSSPYDLLVIGASWSRAQFHYRSNDFEQQMIESIDQAVLIVPAFEG